MTIINMYSHTYATQSSYLLLSLPWLRQQVNKQFFELKKEMHTSH